MKRLVIMLLLAGSALLGSEPAHAELYCVYVRNVWLFGKPVVLPVPIETCVPGPPPPAAPF